MFLCLDQVTEKNNIGFGYGKAIDDLFLLEMGAKWKIDVSFRTTKKSNRRSESLDSLGFMRMSVWDTLFCI